MKLLNTILTRSIATGAVAIGAIAGLGIAAPAQAFVFKNLSVLDWTNATNDFFDDVAATPDGMITEGDELMIVFNNLNPNIQIQTKTGSFVPGFCDPVPGCTDFLAQWPVNLKLKAMPSMFKPTEIRYIVQEDAVFDFGDRTLMPHEGDNVTGPLTWTIPVGTELLAEKTATAAQVRLCIETCDTVPYFTFNGETFGAPPNINGEFVQGVFQDTTGSSLVINDSFADGGGSYDAQSVVIKTTPQSVTSYEPRQFR